MRKRQAAFSFCLKLLDSLIKKEDLTLEEQKQLMALVKALVDMNANYLIRENQFIKLLNIAKKTNTNWSGFDKKLFNEINFAHCIKKMISLTQDTTKSILLEHILVEGSEKGFFNKPVDKQLRCSSFCCSEFLTTQGLMYLENNRIIIDALKDIENNRVALSNKFPYFFDNFGNICKLNNNEQIIKQFELFQKKYQDVIKTLKSEKIEYIDARINSWIKSMLGKDELKVVSFIKDTDVFYNNNDFNKLFEFFMLAEISEKSKEICENFYSNTNRKKIHNLLCRENNMCVYFDSDFVLIEFKKEKETSSENKDTNDIIYLQITGFDTKKIEHWFILKMLFTLRSTFAKLIKHIKLPLLISERSKKMRESALRIVKALTHSNRASYMNMNFFTEQTEYPLAESSLNIPIGEEKFPLEKYLQLISNEWISSLYRKIVRGDLNEDLYNHFNGPITPSIRADYQKEMLKNFWGLKTATPSYIMHIYNESKFEAVRIIFKGLDYFDNFKYAAILPQMASMESIVMVITLMAENVIKHNNKVNDQEYELTVECTTDGDLMFYNESDFSPDMLNNINDIIECPPWVYGCANSNMQTPHITLWTFAHIATIISNIEADGQKEPLFPNFNFVVQNANGRFEVIFEHFFK